MRCPRGICTCRAALSLLTGCIHGKVGDTHAHPMRCLDITLTHLPTGKTFHAMTDEQGRFVLWAPPHGRYRITAARGGYDALDLTFGHDALVTSVDHGRMANRSRVVTHVFEPPALAPMAPIHPEIASRHFMIYLPPQYDEDPFRHFPIIYYIPGNGHRPETYFGENLWQNNRSIMDELTSMGEIPPTLLVVPNGEMPEGWIASERRSSMFVNSPRNGDFEDYVAIDLIDCVERNAGDCLGDGSSGYRVLAAKESRGIVGLCMGVIGAFNIAFKYPHQFCVAASNFGPASLDQFVVPYTEGLEPIMLRYHNESSWFQDYFQDRMLAAYAALDSEHYPDNEFPIQPDGSMTMVPDPQNPGGPYIELWPNFYLDNDAYTYLTRHPEVAQELSFYLDCSENDELQLFDNNLAFSAYLESLGIAASQSIDPSNRHYFELFQGFGHLDVFRAQEQITKALHFTAIHLDTGR